MHMTSLLLVNCEVVYRYVWFCDCLRYNKTHSYWRYRWLLKIISPQLEIFLSSFGLGNISNFGEIIFNSHLIVSNCVYNVCVCVCDWQILTNVRRLIYVITATALIHRDHSNVSVMKDINSVLLETNAKVTLSTGQSSVFQPGFRGT